jgi:orotidine-5'-phosphate decarboxylase
MTELIVALDLDAHSAGVVFSRLRRELSQRWFKVGTRLMLDYAGMIFIENMLREDALLFLDLKLYDTRDTVAATAALAFALGARMLTVHATPSMLAAAMAAKTSDDQKVLAVVQLTDSNTHHLSATTEPANFDGIVCPVQVVREIQMYGGKPEGKIIVCPGIRLVDHTGRCTPRDNHVFVASPAEAREAGADYIVVGRPIINAPDPVAAARAILKELA